jgi:hypothetical protein
MEMQAESQILSFFWQAVAGTVVMWESRREFQGVWEGWKAAFGLSRLSIRRHFHGSM